MNSFFIQPTIDPKIQTQLAASLRQATQKSRIEAEVWQVNDPHEALQTALEQTSPTIIAVGSRLWLDKLISIIREIYPDQDLPVFGHLATPASRLHPLTPFLIRRKVDVAIATLAGRKLTTLPLFQISSAYFTETCSIAIVDEQQSPLKLALQLNGGQLAIEVQASRLDISILEDIQENETLLRLRVQSPALGQQLSQASKSSLLPGDRTKLPTNRFEDVLHIPIRSCTLTSSQPLKSLSHPDLKLERLVTIKPSPQSLRFVTAKNQVNRY